MARGTGQLAGSSAAVKLCEGKIGDKTWVCQLPSHSAEAFKLCPDIHLVLNPPPLFSPWSPILFFFFCFPREVEQLEENQTESLKLAKWSPTRSQPGSCPPKPSWASGTHSQLAHQLLPIHEGPLPWVNYQLHSAGHIYFSSFIYKIRAALIHLSNRISSHRSCSAWFIPSSDQGFSYLLTLWNGDSVACSCAFTESWDIWVCVCYLSSWRQGAARESWLLF